MLKFQEKRILHKILYSRYFLGFMCIPVAGMLYAAYNAYGVERESYERKVVAQKEVARLKDRADGLEKDIARLQDPFGAEMELRKRYEVGRPGEEVIILTGESPSPVVEETVQEAPPARFWDRMRSLF